MEYGLYEKVLNNKFLEKLDDKKYKKIRSIDNSEVARVLSTEYQKIIRETLLQANNIDKAKFIDKLNEVIEIDGFEYDDEKFKELLSIHDDKDDFDILNQYRPRTSISTSTLFTGSTGLTLESELRREIRTSDEIDLLISFIKYSGLRLIYEDLVEFTRKNKLRVITTSYMGASDYKAILKLAELPNTEVKISYDTERTRLHAKAYHFKRHTGFSTAYIGSSNLSNPALSNGLEWNIKVSEYTSKDVLYSFTKSFETYWNDEEFKTFKSNDEKNKKDLKKSLSIKERNNKPYIFFDLNPYSHQREILEELRLERKEYGSYRNLVVAATGARVIIVMGAIFKGFRNFK
ncbi:MAG: restriction endonuclease PLD domain-containing protein [Senegalia sp. (in: firmicutes)]